MKSDLNRFTEEERILVKADKTSNNYLVPHTTLYKDHSKPFLVQDLFFQIINPVYISAWLAFSDTSLLV